MDLNEWQAANHLWAHIQQNFPETYGGHVAESTRTPSLRQIFYGKTDDFYRPVDSGFPSLFTELAKHGEYLTVPAAAAVSLTAHEQAVWVVAEICARILERNALYMVIQILKPLIDDERKLFAYIGGLTTVALQQRDKQPVKNALGILFSNLPNDVKLSVPSITLLGNAIAHPDAKLLLLSQIPERWIKADDITAAFFNPDELQDSQRFLSQLQLLEWKFKINSQTIHAALSEILANYQAGGNNADAQANTNLMRTLVEMVERLSQQDDLATGQTVEKIDLEQDHVRHYFRLVNSAFKITADANFDINQMTAADYGIIEELMAVYPHADEFALFMRNLRDYITDELLKPALEQFAPAEDYADWASEYVLPLRSLIFATMPEALAGLQALHQQKGVIHDFEHARAELFPERLRHITQAQLLGRIVNAYKTIHPDFREPPLFFDYEPRPPEP